jgi:tetratricopeptide (TPR) repeat protein
MIEVHIRSILVSIPRNVLGVMLLYVVAGTNPALTQTGEPARAEQAAAVEFARLVEQWQERGDPEEKIAALETALRLEGQIKTWPETLPISGSRSQVRGTLLNGLGDSYLQFRGGNRADNLEKAIAAYEVALTVRTHETFPRDWAGTRRNLAAAYRERVRGDHADNLEKAIAHFEAALTVFTYEAFPRDWADTQHDLGIAHSQRIRGDRAENVERAIASYQAALTVRTREVSPIAWAATQHNLAIAYWQRIRGDHPDNLEKAIAAYEAALTVRTREAFPRDWAATEYDLAIAYSDRVRGDHADNLEKSIAASEAALTVFNRETSLEDWGHAQEMLANVYRERLRGDPADNLENAIAHYEVALTGFTRESSPRDWSRIHSVLADAYQRRIRGERADNFENAIAASEAALTVLSQTDPEDWGSAQVILGNGYLFRIRGDRGENLEKAIAAYEAALTVRTAQVDPSGWAFAQNSLGAAYRHRLRGDRADNLERAIAAYESALTVRTREASPRHWAATKYNLAIAYRDRVRGDHAANVEKAIAQFEAALTVFTREASPHDWADTQNHLGVAYWQRIRGDRTDNLEKAIAAYESSLTVRTREAVPRDYLETARSYGRALLEKREWQAARSVYRGARRAFLLLFGQGMNDAESQDLVTQAGPLFAEAAFTAVENGELDTALSLLSEGKAHLMSVALRQQNLGLSPEKHARYAAIKVEIRDLSQRAETAKATEAMRVLGQLTTLRQELGTLIEGALGEQARGGNAIAVARMLLAEGGAIVAPIVTEVGGKMLFVTPGENRPKIRVVSLPVLSSERLAQLMSGDGNVGKSGGWLGAYKIQYQPWLDPTLRTWLETVENVGPTLWELFGRVVDDTLQEQGVKSGARLIWLPTGALGLLPIGLAEDPTSHRRLGDVYEVVFAPSLEALVSSVGYLTKPPTATLATAINPTGDLPFTEIEGVLISAHFDNNSRIRLDKSNATPDLVLTALKGKSYWHFSSHGQFDWNDVRKSALLMRDAERLTVGRLLETEGSLGHPRLVALSACETGLYDIERNPDEFIGLPATFMQIGAVGVVASLWQVDDLATALLMAKFYDLHLEEGLPPPFRVEGRSGLASPGHKG